MRHHTSGRRLRRQSPDLSFAPDAADVAWRDVHNQGRYGHYGPYGGSEDQWAGPVGAALTDHTVRFGTLVHHPVGDAADKLPERAGFDSEPYRAERVEGPAPAPESPPLQPAPIQSDTRESSPGLAKADDDDTFLNGRQT